MYRSACGNVVERGGEELDRAMSGGEQITGANEEHLIGPAPREWLLNGDVGWGQWLLHVQ